MINLELPTLLVGVEQMMHAIARDMFRPISRKYDRQEHDVPVELAALDRRKGRKAARDKARGEGKSAQPEAKPENKNGTSMATVVSVQQMCWGDVGLMLSVPGGGLGNAAIDAVATAEQKERFGNSYAAMAITEPGTGSDSANIMTTARLDGDEWVLNGEKIFVTAGARCDTVVVWATLDRNKGKAAIKSFVVSKGTPGMEVVGLEHKMGIRASDTATISFVDCRIPRTNILGNEAIAEGDKAAFGKVMQTFDNTRPTVAAMAVGVARAALDMATEILGVSPDYETPRWQQDATQAELTRMEADWEAARLLVLKAAWMSDNRQPNSMEASMAKAKAGRMGNQVTLRCVELCGSVGYSEEHLLEKFARDSKIIDIFEGTQQIQQLIVARRLLNKSSADLK